jgi:adhesin/invasin
VFVAVVLLACVAGTALAGTAAAQADSVTVETQPNATQTAGEFITGDGAPSPQANVTNSTGAPVSGVDVTVQAVGGAGSITAGTTTKTTNTGGIATFSDLNITKADTYRLNFSIDAADANVSTSDFNETNQFEVEAAQASSLLPDINPGQTQTAGEVITGPPQVTVEDTYDNPVENVDVDVVATNATGSITAGATTVPTDASGIATFDDLVIETADTGYELVFSIDPADSNVENAASLLTPPFDVEAANANTVEVQQQPLATQTAGQTIDGPPTVLVTDGFGNPVQGVDVDVAEVGGYTFDSGTTTVATDGSGLSTFSDLVIETADTGYQLEFSIDNADSDVDTSDTNTTGTFEVQAAAVDGITAFNVTATAGQQGEIDVTAEDEFGNPVEGEDISVDNDGGLTGVNNGDTQTTGADGNATFTFNEGTAGDYSLTFSAQGGAPTDSATVTVESDVADNVTAVAVDDTATADGTETVEYDVTVEDQFGNAVEGVQVQTTSNGSSINFGSNSLTTDPNGRVTVTATSTDAPQTVEFKFTEQQNSNTDTATGTFEVGQPAQVTATQNVGTATADGTAELNYTVTVEDANNNPVSGVEVNTTDNGNDVNYVATQNTDPNGQVFVTPTSTTAQSLTFTFEEQQNSNNDTATGTFEAGNSSGLNLAFDQASLGQGDGNTNGLTVNVQDAQGNAVPNENITLTVEQGSGGLVVAGTDEGQTTTVSTDSNGEFDSEVLYRQVESDSGTTVVVEGVDETGNSEQASYSVGELERRDLSRGDDPDTATGTDRRDRGRGSSGDTGGNRRSRGRGR